MDELYAERLRLAAQAAAEEGGESLWTIELSIPVRSKLFLAWEAVGHTEARGIYESMILRSIGNSLGLSRPVGVSEALLSRTSDHELALSYIEAMSRVIGSEGRGEAFVGRVNEVFSGHRIGFRLVDGTLIPLSSEEMHVAVVEPVLHLLHGDPDLVNADAAYRKALDEIRKDDPGDAITDAGTALQETLVALGCQGRNLGALISDAKQKGLLGKPDDHLTDAIEKALVWAAAERNAGEAHRVREQPLSDAWLMVHITGALIIRLAEGSGREVSGGQA